jgi:hypothetical protein
MSNQPARSLVERHLNSSQKNVGSNPTGQAIKEKT